MHLRICLLCFLVVSIATCSTAQADVFASFDDDFNQNHQTSGNGWAYFWNPTGASIGTASAYQALGEQNNKLLITSSDANDLLNSGNDAGDANARLGIQFNATDNVRWTLGGQNAATATDSLDHYIIVGYTIQAGQDTGDITMNIDSSSGASAIFKTFVNDTEINTTTFSAAGTKDLNFNLGTLNVGDTVYFAAVGDSTQARNVQRFFFSNGGVTLDLAAVPEPSSMALMLGVLGIGLKRRRRS